MEWNYLREILLNRHRDPGFGADWSKREAASVGGLFHFKRNVRCPLLALGEQFSCARVCPLLDQSPPPGLIQINANLVRMWLSPRSLRGLKFDTAASVAVRK